MKSPFSKKQQRLGTLQFLAAIILYGLVSLFFCTSEIREHLQLIPNHNRNDVIVERSPMNKHGFSVGSKHAPTCDQLSSDQVNYTLVTQMSMNRLWMMEHVCQRWQDAPISIGVFIQSMTNVTANEVRQMITDMGCEKSRTAISTITDSSLELYPVNALRNLALSKVATSHVLYLDIDFWPSSDIVRNLRQPQVRGLLAQDPKATFVVPAFELGRQCELDCISNDKCEEQTCRPLNVANMPHNISQLLSQIKDVKVFQFDDRNMGGHGSTRYDDWAYQRKHDLLYIPCLTSDRYEPYLVFRYCRDLPPFQEAFKGYGKNKITWIIQLRRAGYVFWQLGESFVTHFPHRASKARRQWNQADKQQWQEVDSKTVQTASSENLQYMRGINDVIYLDFLNWMRHEVPDDTRVPICDPNYTLATAQYS